MLYIPTAYTSHSLLELPVATTSAVPFADCWLFSHDQRGLSRRQGPARNCEEAANREAVQNGQCQDGEYSPCPPFSLVVTLPSAGPLKHNTSDVLQCSGHVLAMQTSLHIWYCSKHLGST